MIDRPSAYLAAPQLSESWLGDVGDWLRTDGEVFSVPNGQIVKTRNLSKDWARAVVDIPLPVGTDLTHVNRVLKDVARTLPGKQFEAGRDLRALVVGALRRNRITTKQDATAAVV